MILNLNKNKKLSFYRKTEIYIGEKDFDEIQVLLPPEVDGNNISDLTLKLHLVNEKGEYIHIALTKETDSVKMVGSTMIVADLTNIAQDFFIYIEMIKGDNEVIGKTNMLKITINPLPDEKDRIIPKEEYEETIDELTEIIERNTEAMNRINGFEDGKSAYEIAVEHGYEGTEEDWLQSLNGKEGKSAYEIAVEQGYEGTEEEWLSEIKDYSELNNKPQINSHTLSGNQSSDDLGLQKKLTAGTNITIGNDGTISASGGVTSYEDLTDKPKIRVPVYDPNDTYIGDEIDIEDTINMPYGGSIHIDSNGDKSFIFKDILTESLAENLNFVVGRYAFYTYDFNALNGSDYNRAGVFVLWKSRCLHAPSFIDDYFVSGSSNYNFFVIHLQGYIGNKKVRSVIGKDKNGDLRFFIQQIQLDDNGTITSQTDWVELTGGGAQIVSGVVNQNGTITFTDSDGNTFTTTGSSVIGADGVGIADVHIDGGGDLIIEYTTGHMENVGHVVGADGQDYVLTNADKQEIAQMAVNLLPNADSVSY